MGSMDSDQIELDQPSALESHIEAIADLFRAYEITPYQALLATIELLDEAMRKGTIH